MNIKYEIHNLSNDPANTKLRIIKQKDTICDIYEEDLYECLNDNQIKQWEKGVYEFTTLPIAKLKEKAIRIFNPC